MVEKIGPEKIAPLGLKVGKAKYDLLSLTKIPDNTEGGYGSNVRQINGYWMLTKFDNAQKVNFIKKIAEELNLNIKVRINNAHPY